MRSEWVEMKLSKIMDIVGGGTPKTDVPEYWGGDIPWIAVKDFNNDKRFIYATERTITQLGLDNSSTKLLDKGDLVISARGTVGAIAQLSRTMAFNQTSYGLKAKSDIAINDFLYYLLLNITSKIKSNTHGTVFDTITRKTFDVLSANIPPIEVQNAIVKTLDCIDKKIELNNKINENLEQQAQAIFKNWFVDFEPFQDGKFVESELGMIPEGWNTGTFGDIAEVSSGKRPKLKEDIPTQKIKVPIVGASQVMGYTNEFLFKEKILITGRVGTHGIVQRFNTACWPSDNTLVIKSEFYEFAYQVMNSFNYSALNRGSTQPLITQTDIRNQIVVIPPIDVLEEFEDLIQTLMALRSKQISQNVVLAKLRDTLLPKLMSGEIEVPVE